MLADKEAYDVVGWVGRPSRWKVTLSQMTAYLGWWPSICSAGMRIPSREARKVLIWTALKWPCSDLGCLVDFIAVHMMFPTGSYKQWHCSQWCCSPLLSNWKVQLGKIVEDVLRCHKVSLNLKISHWQSLSSAPG